jgi:PAS domain S-box-containing protein
MASSSETADSAAVATRDGKPSERADILLVDDHPAGLVALHAELAQFDEKLVDARRPEEALELLAARSFAVVLIDTSRPALGGFETARRIRTLDSARATPIIFLSAEGIDQPTLEAGYALGDVDFLFKPVLPVVLRAKVRFFLELFRRKRRSEREAEQLRSMLTSLTETEDRLRRTERRFTRFMQHLPGLAWIKDPEGRYVYVNDAAEKAFRIPRERLYGRTDEEVFPPETAAQFRRNDRLAVESPGGGIQTIEQLIDEKGAVRHSLVSKFPILETDGRVSLVGGMAIDITERRRVQEALRESEERFRGLMEQAPFSVQVFSADGQTVGVNRAWEELWGVRADQIGDYNVLADEQLKAKGIHDYLARAFAGTAVVLPAIEYDPDETIPGRTSHADARRWVSAVAYPLKDASGGIREVVLIHRDITAERRAEEARRRDEEALRRSERLYRAVGESIDFGVWICDAEGRNVYVSDSFLRLLGITQDECSEFGWKKFLHPDDADATMAAWKECVRTGDPWDREHRFRGVDGRWHPTLARGMATRDDEGRITGWAGINLDIRRLKEVENQLRDADRRKDEFLATLAHELRNPLAPIRNSLEILKLPRLDPQMADDTRAIMERQVQHLVRLVDDLLDVSRVMRGKIELRREPVEPATIIARAVETAKPLIELQAHRLELAVSAESLLMDADPVRLAQVFGNLLTNSAKYTEAGGLIRLSAERDGDQAVIAVEDSGIGIAADVLPRVFELFVQADNAVTRAQGGLGIGLTLVKNLIELHGGTVEAASPGLGKGSRFTVRLPLLGVVAASPIAPASTAASAETPRSGFRLLVVDDNTDAAFTLAMLLRLKGHEVRVAHDGRSAVEMAAASPPDLVFLDLGMPEIDGFETARRLRALPGLERTLLTALTGWGQEEDRRKTTAAGFDHHLVKPPEPSAIDDLLAELKALRAQP